MSTDKLGKKGLSQVWEKVFSLVKSITGDVDVTNKGDLQAQIDGIDIGGRNYCRNNSYWKTRDAAVMQITNNDDGSVSITKIVEKDGKHCYIPFSESLDFGEYTLTVKYKTIEKAQIQFYTINSNAGVIGVLDLPQSDDYAILSKTVTVAQKTDALFITSTAMVLNSTLDIAWIKVEKGNKSTDWTPNPDDVGTESTLGLTKLYAETGTNADGTMTQSAITTALDDKFGATVSRTANTVLAAPNGSAGGASFRKLVADDIPRLKNSWNFSFSVSGGTVDYRTFAKILKTDTNNSGATLLITDGGDYGNTHVGAWIVHITNRGGNPSMHVRALETSSNIVFGFWSNDDYYYFGAKCEKYSAGLFCTVLSSRGSTTIGKINTTATQPSDWTEVDFLYTPQPSASTSTAGIGKLYTATGTGTDGSMTQNAITTELGKYLPLAGGTVDYLNVSNTAKAKSLSLYLDDGTTTVTGMYHSATNEVIYSSTGLNKAYSSHILKIGSSSGSMYGSGTHFDLDTQIRGRYIALEATKAISSSVSIVTSSDEKVKSFTDDIETDEEKLVELFDIIKPKSYNYKYSKADSLSIGFSAQEIEQAMIDLDIDPEKYGILNIQYGHMLSRGDDEEDGKYYTKFYEISYNDLFNLSLLKMHVMEKEHVARLESIEKRLTALENK